MLIQVFPIFEKDYKFLTVVWIVRGMIRNRKAGKSSCGCDCGSCGCGCTQRSK